MPRLIRATRIEFVSCQRPFSTFDFSERLVGSPSFDSRSPPIRRLFSIARSRDAGSIVVETIPEAGIVAEENEDILKLRPKYTMGELKRISFWKIDISNSQCLEKCEEDACIGYAILKEDIDEGANFRSWHIFEAVIRQSSIKHNYHPASACFKFRVAEKELKISGCLYAQQNGLNKACAQVALRSICATYLADPDLSYRTINQLAENDQNIFNPADGLEANQIIRVLEGLGIPHFAVDYTSVESIRDLFPYQKPSYSGIESGSGALVAFDLEGPNAPEVGHIIPFFGHTFNEDSWAPCADGSYFKIGTEIRYIPSRAWMSSFIAHDDNFGANLCIPQTFLDKKNVSFVVELLPPGYVYSGTLAEIVAADYFYSLLHVTFSENETNPWILRLIEYVKDQSLILRHIPITVSKYIDHLTECSDWENNKENNDSIKDLRELKPEKLWMVEVSVPEVFSTNKRKLGEVLLDAENQISEKIDGTSFVLARFPERYAFFDDIHNGTPRFDTSPSNIRSHVPLYTL